MPDFKIKKYLDTMKILFVLGLEVNPKLGGVERVTHILTNYFVQKEIEVMFLYFRQTELYFPQYNQNIETFYLPNTDDLLAKENVTYFRNLLLQTKTDIVVNQGNIADMVTVLIAEAVKETESRVISVLHNTPFNFSQFYGQFKQTQINTFRASKKSFKNLLKRRLIKLIAFRDYNTRYKKYLKLSISSSDRFVLLSDAYIPVLNKILKSTVCKKNVAIPNPSSFNQRFPESKITNKKKQVIYVGRLDMNQKRVDRLLYAWHLIEADFSDWQLIVIGGNLNVASQEISDSDYQSNEMARLKSICNKLKLQNVVFTGNISPVPYYEESSIIGLTSNYEGFPMVLVEAIQYAVVPVVFGSFEAIFDLIEDKKNGLIVTPFEINQFAASLKYLMEHDEKRQEMAFNALITSENYSIEAIGDRWIKMFNEIRREKNTNVLSV